MIKYRKLNVFNGGKKDHSKHIKPREIACIERQNEVNTLGGGERNRKQDNKDNDKQDKKKESS